MYVRGYLQGSENGRVATIALLQIVVIISREKNFPFYTLLGSDCVLISYSMLSLIIAWLG